MRSEKILTQKQVMKHLIYMKSDAAVCIHSEDVALKVKVETCDNLQ